MKAKRKFILVTPDTSWDKVVFADLLTDARVEKVFNGVFLSEKSGLIRYIRKFHLSKKVNRIIELPGKQIWKCCLDSIEWDDNTIYYIIFMSPLFLKIPVSKLEKFKKQHNVRYVCFHLDCLKLEDTFAEIQKYQNHVGLDYTFSFDPQDSQKYDLIFNNSIYSMLADFPKEDIEYDLFLAAYSKERLASFHAIYDQLRSHKVKAQYRIVGVSKRNQIFEGILYNKALPYPDVLRELNKSNCILEVLYDGQSGATLRYYEAVCYNKKLLTNNKNVVNLPFYDPDYMKVFENPEDIDWNWVKERVPVDYHYDGRFSPVHLIDKIIELEDAKNKP